MNGHIKTLFRYFMHGKERPLFEANGQELLDAVKWAAARREGVELPNGRRVFVDWKDDPAQHEIFDAVERMSQCNR